MKVIVTTKWPSHLDGLRVIQTNSRPSKRPEKTLLADTGFSDPAISVWVPHRAAGMQVQTDVDAWKGLVHSYGDALSHAVTHGYMRVCMPALGTSLYWPATKSALAAKMGLNAMLNIPQAFEVTFVVPKRDIKVWIDEMSCYDLCSE